LIKITAVVRPKAGVSLEDCIAYYYERHGPLAASVPEFTRIAFRYKQNYPSHLAAFEAPAGLLTGFAALTEMWLHDLDELKAAYSSPGFTSILKVDELKFLDLSTIIVGLGTEHRIEDEHFDDPVAAVARQARQRLFLFRKSAKGVDTDAFQKAWFADGAAAIRASDAYSRYARSYVQTHVFTAQNTGLPGASDYDLIDEFWCATESDAVRLERALRSDAEVSAAAKRLSDPAADMLFIGREHIVYGPDLPQR
jgi:hypothetical protein